MTLNLMIVNRHGAWLSADFRISREVADKTVVVDDESPKYLTLQAGAESASIVYSGIGAVPVNGRGLVHISDWMRGGLRGTRRNLDQGLRYLCEMANGDLAPVCIEEQVQHNFLFAIFSNRRPFYGQIANGHNGDLSQFHYLAREVPEGGKVMGAGRFTAVAENDICTLIKISAVRPRKPTEFNELLYGINARASAVDDKISKHCITLGHGPEPGSPGFRSIIHSDRRMKRPLESRWIALDIGLDMTEATRACLNPSAPGADPNDATRRRNFLKP